MAAVRRWVGRIYVGAGVILIVLVVVATVYTLDRDLSMSASVGATIEDAVPATWNVQRGTETGMAVTYSFVVNGSVYRDTAKRTWVDVEAAAAKVCFDPRDPAGRHRLVPGAYTCAGLNPLEDFGQW